ncbi:MAG TPA: 4-hydroxy-tetrahydrodipicolinate synthase [Oceanipulchritudo sp.]|nr:4-hydroxy-tetrahydrodipicolinate synthase [Oceanipulchritudo sp.]
MSETQPYQGVYTALITPMNGEGQIDWETLSSHVEAQIRGGIDGLVPTGTTGESPTLDTTEHLKVIERVVAAAGGRVPVIAGTGANSTREALQLTAEADRIGADAFLQVAPYYNKPSQEGLFQHFREIADSTGKPVILYSIPGRCGIEISVETVHRLVKACPNIRTIKEAGGDPARVPALLGGCPELTVLSGDDGLVMPFIQKGAKGVISVASNLAPDILLELTRACLEDDFARAEALVVKWEALLTDLVFMDGNPVTVKEVLFQSGRIPSPVVRLPLVRMSVEHQESISDILQTLNLGSR